MRNSITTTYTYNDVDQGLSESYSGGTLGGLAVTNVYDTFLRRVTNNAWNGATKLAQSVYGYDAASRLATVGDGTNTAGYAYLANSPLVSQIAFTNNGTLRTTTNQYDNLNRLTTVSTLDAQLATINSYNYGINDANQRVRAREPAGREFLVV